MGHRKLAFAFWFLVFFCFVLVLLILPLRRWFVAVALVVAITAYWYYRWVNGVREKSLARFEQELERTAERRGVAWSPEQVQGLRIVAVAALFAISLVVALAIGLAVFFFLPIDKAGEDVYPSRIAPNHLSRKTARDATLAYLVPSGDLSSAERRGMVCLPQRNGGYLCGSTVPGKTCGLFTVSRDDHAYLKIRQRVHCARVKAGSPPPSG